MKVTEIHLLFVHLGMSQCLQVRLAGDLSEEDFWCPVAEKITHR